MDSNIFTQNNKYLMLALDHRNSFKKAINPSNPDQVTAEQAIEIKKEIIKVMDPLMTGTLVDFDYGLVAYHQIIEELGEQAAKPFLLPMEESGYQEVDGERTTNLKYNAEDLVQNKAKGAKLLLYFNPHAKSAGQQLEIAKQALQNVHDSNLPFFLEIVHYNTTPQQSLLESLKMFLEESICPDVFKLEYPGSAENCKKVTETLQCMTNGHKGIPWILLTRGVEFEEFVQQLQVSMEAGCSGFLAGRSVWQEAVGMPDQTQREEFLSNTAKNRFEQICQIALNS